jgi:ABC-type transporter Mla subunit MlaD
MRFLVPVPLVIAVVVAVLLARGGGEEPYKVRAIFDNAGFVIPGEDVKVAGVKVGKIDSLDVTDDFKVRGSISFTSLMVRSTPLVANAGVENARSAV